MDALTRRYLNGQALSPAELDALSPSARAVRTLLDGTSREVAEVLYANLPPGFRDDLARVSPSAHVSGIQARLLVMHDRHDRLVPAAESRRLLAATEDRGDVRYTEVLAFEHVRPSGGGIGELLGEAARLYWHMYSIIRLAT